ncbi:hypothetical protein ACIHCQ_43435 [Streptomyces sp. NPDC052236]|uniref:hypothetical protein n=1 Tax=Streptomyces sp. NPDC052236 TaxID=3365686 RepID=UPI0037D67086
MRKCADPLGIALLNTIFASVLADSMAGQNPKDPAVLVQAGLDGYAAAYWWSAAFFAAGLIISFALYRRGVPTQNPDATPTIHM